MMAAAVKEEVEAGSCPLYRRRACSPGIPRVTPGTDYLCIPAGADNSHAWSLLVGFLSNSHSNSTNNSGLGLHRFRVARSGRILGRSDDALDILRTLRTIKGCSAIASVSAELTPDGCSICLFSEHLDPDMAPAIPRASELRVTRSAPAICTPSTPKFNMRESRSLIIMSPLPRIPPDSPKKCRPVSAAGHLWAPNIKLDVPTSKCFLGMLRLNRDAKRWEKAGDTFSFPLQREELVYPRWGGPLFQGYAVLHNNTILVSLRADQGLLTFNCFDCTWTEVTTTKDNHTDYIPIRGRGVHIKKHVYFLHHNCIFAYKLCYDQDQKYHQRKLKLEPPAMIDPVCPFYEEGYGFLTHLGGRLMCSVWISTLLRCSCDYQHVLITTFRIRSTKAKPIGIDILHSTCRRLHVFPLGLPIHEFCFVQVYEDKGAVKPSTRDYTTSSHVTEGSSKMLDCCRVYEDKGAVKPSMRDHPTSSHVTEGSSKMLDCCRVYEDKGAVKPSMRDHPTSSHVTEGSSKMLDCCSTSLSELGHNKFEDPPKVPALQINKL